MDKLDLSSLASDLRKKFSKEHPHLANKIGVGSNLSQLDPDKDFIKMPKWWTEATRTPGLAFGRITMLAGVTDSGKTSAAIVAMKQAQDQGCGVIYVETENKTSEVDLLKWGVDTDKILVIPATVAEDAFTVLFEAWDGFVEKYPGVPLLVVFDSIGGVIAKRDTEIDIQEEHQKPGGKGQINKWAISNIIVRRDKTRTAVLLINHTYDNIGSVGKTNAGGQAVNLQSSLIYQTSRKKTLYRTVKGVEEKYGAEVVWKFYKNHLFKDNPGPKTIELKITADGVEYLGGKDGDEE